jgi:hypothetical protein
MHSVAVAGPGLALSGDKAGKCVARSAAQAVRLVPECGMCPEGCECTAGSGPVRNQCDELPLREDLTPVFAG